jgi:hypothetical protein
MTDDTCPPSKKNGHHTKAIGGDVAVQAYVCYDDKTFYVLDRQWVTPSGICAEREPVVCGNGQYQYNLLPGGTVDNLSGGEYGGVRLDDIVISSYQGYLLNGNQNGYQMPNASNITSGLGDEGDLPFPNGIQTPGFFSLPIYT